MYKMESYKVKSKIFPLKATNDLFAKISLVTQTRSFDLRSIFKFPLGPFPWSLAEPSDAWKKTLKTSLLHKIKSKVRPLEILHEKLLLIIDNMTYVQQSKVHNKTFCQFAMDLSSKILAAGKIANCAAVVFEDYRLD